MDDNNSTGLFRAQAISHQNNNLLGKVLVVPKSSVAWVSVIILIWVIACFFWLCTAQYSRQVTVTGWLEPVTGVAHHFASLNNAVVTDIYISPGDIVEKGQPLMRLTSERRNVLGQKFNSLIREELLHKRLLLNSEVNRLDVEFKNKQRFLSNQFEHVAQEQQKLVEIKNSTDMQYQLAKQYSDKMEALYQKGWLADLDLNNAKSQTLQLHTQLSNLDREKIQLIQQLNSTDEELALLPSAYGQSKNQIEQEIVEINQRIIQLDASETEIVFAKTSGKISDIYLSKGNQTDTKPLLTIVPEDQTFVAMLPIPTQSAGFVEKGQSLSLRYDAYPHEKFGTQPGRVTSVSSSILLPSEVPNAATAIEQPVYMVKAAIESSQILAYGEEIALKSGNTFSADVSLGKRTILEWLFAPLLSLKGRL